MFSAHLHVMAVCCHVCRASLQLGVGGGPAECSGGRQQPHLLCHWRWTVVRASWATRGRWVGGEEREEGKCNCDRRGFLVGFSGVSKHPCKCLQCSQISHRDHIWVEKYLQSNWILICNSFEKLVGWAGNMDYLLRYMHVNFIKEWHSELKCIIFFVGNRMCNALLVPFLLTSVPWFAAGGEQGAEEGLPEGV